MPFQEYGEEKAQEVLCRAKESQMKIARWILLCETRLLVPRIDCLHLGFEGAVSFTENNAGTARWL